MLGFVKEQISSSGKRLSLGKKLLFFLVLLLLPSAPCQAGTPSTVDVVGSILWRGILPPEGYGYFHWKDKPQPGGPVTCTSNPFHTMCTAKDGLAAVGPFPVKKAEYFFEYGALKRVKLSLDVPETWREGGTLPRSLLFSEGDIDLRFFLLSDTGFLVLTNHDPDGRKRCGRDALSTAPDSVSEYLGELSRSCPDCSAVLTDYLAKLGADAPTEPKEVNRLLMDNPTVCSLLTLKSTGDDLQPDYQAILDGVR